MRSDEVESVPSAMAGIPCRTLEEFLQWGIAQNSPTRARASRARRASKRHSIGSMVPRGSIRNACALRPLASNRNPTRLREIRRTGFRVAWRWRKGCAQMRDLAHMGLWYATLPRPIEPRAALERDERVDVAIVGAGYSGLWTAYYLTALEPGIRVAIVEAEFAGFGASGRNGGWCLGSMAGLDALGADPARRDAALRLQRALFDAVDEVGRVCAQESIACDFAKGGWLCVASAPGQRDRLRADLAEWHAQGLGEDDARWLEPGECAARVRMPRSEGALFWAHCAALHPARLVRGLADAVERRGVAIHERSPALAIEPGGVVLRGARLRADRVVR